MARNLTRTEKLVHRFFDIIKEGGEYNEVFLIRDLLMSEYIEGRERQLTVGMIEEIIEEYITPQIEESLEGMDEADKHIGDKSVALAYLLMSMKDIDGAIEVINHYGEWKYSHPYIYYCMVRELERVTGENYIELCL